MKYLLTKTLFISLLLSAAIPSGVQANIFTDISGKFSGVLSKSADLRTSAKNRIADLSEKAENETGKIWNNSVEYRANATKIIANFLDKRPKLKYAGAAVVITGVLCGLNHKFDLAAKAEKKTKEAWNNKWVRYGTYSTGTILAATALYVGLVRKGYLPKLSMDDLQRMIKSFNPCNDLAKKEAEEAVTAERRAEEAVMTKQKEKIADYYKAVDYFEATERHEQETAKEVAAAVEKAAAGEITKVAEVAAQKVAGEITKVAEVAAQKVAGEITKVAEASAQKAAEVAAIKEDVVAAETANDMAELAQTAEIQEPAEVDSYELIENIASETGDFIPTTGEMTGPTS